MRVGDTIIARSSPAGRSARAVVRLSGPMALGVVERCVGVEPSEVRAAGEAGRARVGPGKLGLGGRLGLACVVMRWKGPGSATGEDVCEVLVPGNPALVERVIERLIEVGDGAVRRAEAGEFTARAFLNGKLDLLQAEGIARTIAARREAELAAAARLTGGEAGARVRRWTDELTTLLALTEAGIDFSDQEDVVAIAPEALRRRAATVVREIDGVLVGAATREHVERRARVVMVGRPNAGKSTLFNALLGRGRAVVSERAGSTRDVLVEELDLSGERAGAGVIEVCDVAGVVEGGADGAGREGESARAAQAAARGAIASCDAVVVCEPSGAFAAIESSLGELVRGKPVVRVRTKADLPMTRGGVIGGLEVCALDGYGMAALRRALAEVTAEGRVEGDVLPRHAAAMESARDSLARVNGAHGAEITAAWLRDALDALGAITGRTTTEEVLGRVFAVFCVGK